jgi:sentrin-specific protease 8
MIAGTDEDKGAKNDVGYYDDDQLIINYNDVCVYGRDYKLLKTDDSWLNDTIMQYQLVRLQEVYAPHKHTLFLDPAVISFFMHQCEDLDEFIDFWNGCNNGFENSHRIVLPINDTMSSSNKNWCCDTGTHWSLLVLDIPNDTATSNLAGYHFDSITQSGNYSSAQDVARKMQSLFDMKNPQRNTSLETTNTQSHSLNATMMEVIQECVVPKQCNGYDCGVHALINAETIARQPYNFIIESNMESHIQAFIATITTRDRTENKTKLIAQHYVGSIIRQRIANDILEKL